MARSSPIDSGGSTGAAAARCASGAINVEADIKGDAMGVIGVESGTISSGLFGFCDRDWPTSPVKARGLSASIGLSDGAGVERAREAARRDAGPDPRVTRGLEAADEGENDDEPCAGRVFDSMITIPSSVVREGTAPGRFPWAAAADHRAGVARSAIEEAGPPAAVERPGPASSARADGENPPPGPPRAGPSPDRARPRAAAAAAAHPG